MPDLALVRAGEQFFRHQAARDGILTELDGDPVGHDPECANAHSRAVAKKCEAPRRDAGPVGGAFEVGAADRKIPHDAMQCPIVLRQHNRRLAAEETLIPPALRWLDADMDRQQQYCDADHRPDDVERVARHRHDRRVG